MKKWCVLCGEPVNADSAQGWLPWHLKEDGYRCYCPTTTNRDWKAAAQEEAARTDTSTLLGQFNVALGCLEDASYWLDKAAAQFPEDDDEQWDNPFWGDVEEARKSLRGILADLERAEKDLPKAVPA